MPEQKHKQRSAGKRKGKARGRKSKSRRRGIELANSAIVPAKTETLQMAQPRPRIRLRSAMRAAGLDEWKIAWNLNAKIDELSVSKKSTDKKLLLDYLKEASRHLDPASASAAASQEAAQVEVVHQVARPDRSSVSS